jgi:hypothetical protein
MRKDKVTPRNVATQLLGCLQQGFVIGDKDLDVIAQPGQFTKRTDKIRDRPRRPVPNEHGKTFAAKIRSDCAPDNSEADYANVLVGGRGE